VAVPDGGLVPEVIQPSTLRHVQFRGQRFGGYDPRQVDALLEKAAQAMEHVPRALLLPDGTRNSPPEMVDIPQLRALFRDARFRRKSVGYNRDDVDAFLERASAAVEELAVLLEALDRPPSNGPEPQPDPG
jgi:DivIVA domain-containing protein